MIINVDKDLLYTIPIRYMYLIVIYESLQYSMDCNTVIIYILKMHEYMHNKIGMHRQKKTA